MTHWHRTYVNVMATQRNNKQNQPHDNNQPNIGSIRQTNNLYQYKTNTMMCNNNEGEAKRGRGGVIV
jgi:hypothetical protein